MFCYILNPRLAGSTTGDSLRHGSLNLFSQLDEAGEFPHIVKVLDMVPWSVSSRQRTISPTRILAQRMANPRTLRVTRTSRGLGTPNRTQVTIIDTVHHRSYLLTEYRIGTSAAQLFRSLEHKRPLARCQDEACGGRCKWRAWPYARANSTCAEQTEEEDKSKEARSRMPSQRPRPKNQKEDYWHFRVRHRSVRDPNHMYAS